MSTRLTRQIISLLAVLFVIIFFTISNHGCKEYGNIDTLPRFTQHCWDPTWSPDGKTIAFGYVPWIKVEGDTFIEKWDSAGIYFIDADGKNRRPFLIMAEIRPFLALPDFSPDGTWLVFTGGPGGTENLHKARVQGDSIIQLTFNNYRNLGARWSPDGKKILFGRTDAPLDSSGLCLMDADGLNNKVINQEPAAECGDFFPNYWIAFLGWVKNSRGLWITDTIGSNKINININRYADHDGGISCSPDGSKILFCIYNEEEIQLEIWVMYTDGSNPKMLCIDGAYPYWSPDGSKIVYVKYNFGKRAIEYPGYGELWVMDADGSNQRQLTYPD